MATLVVSRDALANRAELEEFLHDITALDAPPDGFYVLVSSRGSDARSEMSNADVICGWLMINYSLKVNGFRVVNGFSDLLSPFLGAVGGDVGCTGWWSNLRTFSLERFVPSSTGGRLPVQRYLSTSLLNRIRFDELNAWKRFSQNVVNRLPTDNIFIGLEDGEPERSMEVLQSWDALGALMKTFSTRDVASNLKSCSTGIERANLLYDELRAFGARPDPKSNDEHLEPLKEGIRLFRRIAEV